MQKLVSRLLYEGHTNIFGSLTYTFPAYICEPEMVLCFESRVPE